MFKYILKCTISYNCKDFSLTLVKVFRQVPIVPKIKSFQYGTLCCVFRWLFHDHLHRMTALYALAKTNYYHRLVPGSGQKAHPSICVHSFLLIILISQLHSFFMVPFKCHFFEVSFLILCHLKFQLGPSSLLLGHFV